MMEDFNHAWCANDVESSYLIHPGDIILDELEYLGITQKQLAEKIGVPRSQVNETLHGKRNVNYEFALLVQKALGIDAETLLKMQHSYDIAKAKRNRAFMEKLQRIVPFAAASL
ncbi:MAG: HigA family addiction module antidote protein [Bacteroidales bacterium]|nr:HigA family addiction module antidote protein [Bacteroidales bacterium]